MPDSKNYKINIDPRILELLGPSLYTNIYYILAELIANAYDANAKNVYIIQKNDKLIVEDDGNGMSYINGDVQKFLNVAVETRKNDDDSFVEGSNGTRKKMGRKGVGKLAALSVSEEVEILTTKNDEKSGFILSRNVPDNHELEPIAEDNINFERIRGNGTSIVMRKPHYSLHKTHNAIKNNLLKIFPLVNQEFKIHILLPNKKDIVINSFEEEIIKGLGGLIILGDDFEYLSKSFNCQLKDRKSLEKYLLKIEKPYEKVLTLERKDLQKSEFLLEIKGWIGIYRTSRGKKADTSDFPDNFISLLSNKKLGEFNILPTVGKNALNEVYIVGQLHIDLFEESSLPDMALSNRQGYKTDDKRYREVISYVRNDLLPKTIALRAKYASYNNDEKNIGKDQKKKESEEKLRKQVEEFKRKASTSAATKIAFALGKSKEHEELFENAIEKAINNTLPNLGLKKSVDDAKRKILISHTSNDKTICDFIYNLLIFNRIPPQDIIYTNSENHESRIPQRSDIFEYLRDFFVDSISTEKILVIYVTSDNMAQSWPAVSEVGAGWITKSTHDIFNIDNHRPKSPLNVNKEWINIVKDTQTGAPCLNNIGVDKVAEKLMLITRDLGYESKNKEYIIDEIKRTSNILDDA